MKLLAVIIMTICLFVAVPDPVVTGSDVSAAVGSPAVLTCNVSGNPAGTTITYQWKRAGSTVPGATSAMYQVSSSVGVSDAGVYTCEATVSDTGNNPHVISGSDLVDVTLYVASKQLINLSRHVSKYKLGKQGRKLHGDEFHTIVSLSWVLRY